MDSLAAAAYRFGMQMIARILTVLFLALLAAGTVAQTMGAQAMTGEAMYGDQVGADMHATAGCDDEACAAFCELACAAPSAAPLPGMAACHPLVLIPAHGRSAGAHLPQGLRAAPEPLPPRPQV